MALNSWKNKEDIDMFMDRTRNARFSFHQYALAYRQVQNWVFDAYKQDEIGIRDNLFTLLKFITPPVTLISQSSTDNLTINHIAYPSDYRYYSSLTSRIDGNLVENRPLSYNQLSNTLLDSFRKPDNVRVYQLEDSLGWRIYRGFGSTLACELAYLINPSDWSIGTETNLINAAVGSVLTLGANYTSTTNSVAAGIKYSAGDQFNATTTILTSGQVIPTSVLVNSNMPESIQHEINRYVSWLMQGTVSAFDKAKFSQSMAVLEGK